MDWVRSSTLSRSKIRDVIKYLGSSKDIILHNLHEYVPAGDFSEEERLSFIIASIPRVGSYPAKMIAAMIQQPVLVWNPPGNEVTKPVMVHRWASEYPERLHEIATFIAPHKHVPDDIKGNEEWCCIVALGQMIDWAVPRRKWPASGVPTSEELDKLFKEWQSSFPTK